MANYYTEFSFDLEIDPDQEETLREIEESARSTQDSEFSAAAQVVYDFVESKGKVIISHPPGGRGDPADAAAIVAEFLSETDSDRTVTFTYCNRCAKPRPGSFSGGAVVVTKDGYHLTNGYNEAKRLKRISSQDEARVQVNIDVTEGGPEEAAQKALDAFQKPTTATVFTVYNPLPTEVDLMEEGSE